MKTPSWSRQSQGMRTGARKDATSKSRLGIRSLRDRRRLICETLEARLLMAGDVTLHQSFLPDAVGPQPDSGFARSLDAGDRYLVVGAPFVDTASGNQVGQAYVYDAADQLVATLEAPESHPGGYFGHSVATEGDRVVVLGRQSVNGLDVHVIHLYRLAGGAAQLERSIPTNIPVPGINAPYDIAINGDELAIGVPTDSGSEGVVDSGAVFVYSLSAADGTAPLKIDNPEPVQYDRFGSSVELRNGILLVGVPLDGEPTRDETGTALDHGNAGSVMVFDITVPNPTRLATIESPQPQPEMDGRFGTSLAVEGNTLIVGEPGVDAGDHVNTGAFHVFDLETISAPVRQAFIVNPVPGVNDQFGASVDLNGSRIVVGAPLSSIGAGSAGVAYLFDLSEGLPTPTDPNRYATLPNPTPELRDNFGSKVALRGTSIWVTAPFDPGMVPSGSSWIGSVERFESTESGVVSEGQLFNPTPATEDRYGDSVALTNRWMAIGVPAEDGGNANTGRVEIYDLASGTAVLRQSIAPENLPAEAKFGSAVAIHNDTLVVAAPGGTLFGRVYLYDLSTGTATLVETIDSPNPTREQEFGSSLAFDGSRLLVGDRFARNEDLVNAGAAYIYAWDGSQATLSIQIDNPAPDIQDMFGESVAIDGTTVVVGAFRDDGAIDFSGLAHVFKLSATGATLYATLDSPNPGSANGFGGRVGVSGDAVLVGVMGDDTLETNSGAVYVYDTAGPTPVLTQTILRANSSNFGVDFAIDGDRLAVGAQGERLDGVSGGAVHLYQRVDGIYQPQSSLTNPNGGILDRFGSAVAMSADHILVGAPGTDSVGKDQGAAYLFAFEPAIEGMLSVVAGTLDGPTLDEGKLGFVEVTRSGSLDADLRVELSADESEVLFVDDHNQATRSLTIPAGEASARLRILAVQDFENDGDQPITLNASANHYAPGAADLTVVDLEPDGIGLNFGPSDDGSDPQLSESDGTVSGQVDLGTILPYDVTIRLSSTDESELIVPESVTVPAFHRFADVSWTVVADGVVDGSQTVTVTATPLDTNLTPQVATVLVTDVDVAPSQPGLWLLDDGTLLIIGTADDDRVVINQDSHELSVRTRFGDGRWQTNLFQISEVSRIVVRFGDGEDRLQVTKKVSTPVITDDTSADPSNRKAAYHSLGGGWFHVNGDRHKELQVDEALRSLLDEWSAAD